MGLVIPKLTCRCRVVRASYEPGDEWTPPTLLSDWSDGMDPSDLVGGYDGPSNDTDLWVSGIFAPPSVCAGWVSAWFKRLSSPVPWCDASGTSQPRDPEPACSAEHANQQQSSGT